MRVLVDPFLAGPRSLGAYQAYGGFASYAVAPAEAVLPIPGDLSFDQACNLLGNYETAYHCLVTRGALAARRDGADPRRLGLDRPRRGSRREAPRRDGDRDRPLRRRSSTWCAAQGADHVIDATTRRASLARRRQGAHRTAAASTSSTTASAATSRVESLRCVRFGARFLIVGWAATPFVASGKGQRGAPNANVLPTNLIMMKGLDVLGCPTAISTVEDPSHPRAATRAGARVGARPGKIRRYVSHAFPLAEFKTAMRAKWHGEVVGGCVLHPWP